MKPNTLLHLIRTRKNTVWLVSLSITIAISQFIVYRTINQNLGKEMLGVWALVVAGTAIGQISNFGFSSSIVRFFPEMISKNDIISLRKMMGTINISNFLFTLPLLAILYFPAIYYGKILLDPEQYATFHEVFLLSMVALYINNLFLVYSYTLDAMERHHVRSRLQIAGWVIYLLLSIALLPGYGLKGVAIATLVQNSLQLLIIVFLVSRTGLLKRLYPLRFDKSAFKKVMNFGIHSQGISILIIFFDPLIKFFITKYTGLSGAGNYELANKVVVQVKNLLVSASQVIIPKMVRKRVSKTENSYFSKISSNNTILSASAGMCNILMAPVAVYFFSGYLDMFLLQCILLLNIGWTFNMMTIPHYFSSISLDRINRLVIYHLLLSVVVLAAYLIIAEQPKKALLCFGIPPLALFIGGLYNSYLLRNIFHAPFAWLRSGYLFFFAGSSMVLLIAIEYTKMNIVLIIAVIVLTYICWLYRGIKNRKINQFIKSYD